MSINTQETAPITTGDDQGEISKEELDALIVRSAEDHGFYREGLSDTIGGRQSTKASIAFVALDSLRPFSER